MASIRGRCPPRSSHGSSAWISQRRAGLSSSREADRRALDPVSSSSPRRLTAQAVRRLAGCLTPDRAAGGRIPERDRSDARTERMPSLSATTPTNAASHRKSSCAGRHSPLLHSPCIRFRSSKFGGGPADSGPSKRVRVENWVAAGLIRAAICFSSKTHRTSRGSRWRRE